LAAGLLAEAGFAATTVGTVVDLVQELRRGAGLCVVSEEAFRGADLAQLSEWLAVQPPWSDFPFVLLTGRGGGPERNPDAARLWDVLGNVSFLERPFHPTTLVSVVRAALRGRRRQYEARARLEEVRRVEDALRRSNETLEERVAERSRALGEQMIERARVEAQLRQSQKVEAIGKLTGGVAHDFNNLLMAVLGNLSLLRKHLGPDDARSTRLIDGAMQGAQRGAALTQRLLAFARQQDLSPTAVDVGALVRGMEDLLRRSLGPRIDLRIDARPAVRSAIADANQLELVVLNLAVNARDAMPDGGQLAIMIDEEPPNAVRSADEPASAPLRWLRLRMRDTGVGMDEATLSRAVEPFFSTKPLGKGTGLGLSMVHGAVKQMGGDLQLVSAPGQGTTAAIWLPAALSTTPAALVTPNPAERPRQLMAPLHVLLVDDDPLIARSTADMLEDIGHIVLEADGASRALALLQGSAEIDILLTDYAMPGMTGLELIEAARGLRPDLPVVLASGFADLPEGTIPPGLPRLAKPYRQDRLAILLGEVVPDVVRQGHTR
jgi:signal transduction histidine kinase